MTSTDMIGRRAIIAGAGIGGLAAAAALAPLFESVVVHEKDRFPDDPRPRKGVAQGAHVHVFLVGGLVSLELLFPAILDDFRAAGAHRVELGDFDMFDGGLPRPRRDLGIAMLCLSRPSYEQVLRGRVAALPNVALHEGSRAETIAIESGRAVGLRLRDGGIEGADFVVDATGRGAGLAALLRDRGHGEVPEIGIGIDMSYASARFRLAERWRGASAAMCVPTPPDKRYGVVLPIEDGECVVSLGGRCGVAPDGDPPGFLDYARRLASPGIFERIKDAEPTGPIRRYNKPTADWRRYDLMKSFPERLAPVGDTVASFNPTWGQGMTVAVRQALALREALAETGVDGPAFARRYLPSAAAAAEAAWTSTALIDLAYPEVTGERPPDFAQSLAFAQGLRLLADADPDVHRLQFEVLHLMRPAAELMEPELAGRAFAAGAQASSSTFQ
jgi:2-polyprenyl-6-methoxyphenol hydroxylase-like FAD-dependent oxidoreductase